MFSVHSEKMFLDVIRSVELFLTDVTLKRFLFSVDVLVSGEEISSVGGVRTIRTSVSFGGTGSFGIGRDHLSGEVGVGGPGGRLEVFQNLGTAGVRFGTVVFQFVLEPVEILSDFLQYRIVFDESVRGVVSVYVVLAAQVHPHASRPCTFVGTLGTLKSSQIGVRP